MRVIYWGSQFRDGQRGFFLVVKNESVEKASTFVDYLQKEWEFKLEVSNNKWDDSHRYFSFSGIRSKRTFDVFKEYVPQNAKYCGLSRND